MSTNRADLSGHAFHNPLFSAITHLRLLGRVDRTMAVARAVERLIKPGMRVLDAGCGTGLLSFLAARAGASEIVSVDRENVALARELARENGLSDKIRFIEGDLTTLPDETIGGRFDAIIAFVYTNHLVVDEARSALVSRMRAQFGNPDCVVIPDRVCYVGAACDWPGADASTELEDLGRAITDMERRYQLSFSALRSSAAMELQHTLARPRINADYDWSPSWGSGGYRYQRGGFRRLSGEVQVVDIDYGAATPARYPERVGFPVLGAGACNAILWTQELWSAGHLLWTAEHMSPLRAAVAVDADDRLAVQLDAGWRRTNTIARACKESRS
jgi:SAM-dependent methyltransferase